MATATFGILGPVVVHADGREIHLSGKRRAALAALLLHVNSTVSRDRLIAALWEEPPVSAVANVQTHITQLRRALPVGTRLLTKAPGYVLEAARDDVDLLVFEDEVRLARVEPDPAAAAPRLERALALWRGRPAEDAPLGPVMAARLAELEERLAEARSDWAQAQLELGMHAEVIGELRAFAAEQPLRERGWQQLMLALWRSGRRGEALDAYRQARDALVTELGLEPGPDLRRLQSAILSGDEPPPPRTGWPELSHATEPGARPSAAASPGAEPSQAARPGKGVVCQLPADIADFVGRARELETLLDALRPADGTVLPIAAITGPPGVGKSTLAVRAAHLLRPHYPDGQLYLRLSGASTAPREPGALLAELLRALGVDGGVMPESAEERATLFRSLLADRAVLVVLDDAADGPHVRDLLPGTPRSAVLVTSRGPLTALPGAVTIQLGAPSEDEARELLESVAGGARVRADPAAARTILLACGLLPLAIRIAGARLAARPAWPLKALAARLAEPGAPLDELALAGQDLRTHFAMGYEVLPEPARRAFRLVGLAGLESSADWSVAALMGVPLREAEAAVEALALAGLITANEVDGSGQPRYRMHDLLRAFAGERARAEESEQARRAALAGFVTACVDRVRVASATYPPPNIPPMDPHPPDGGAAEQARAWLLAERETLETAVELAEPETAAELAHRLTPFLVAHAFIDEAVRLLEGVVRRTAGTGTDMLTRLLLADLALERRHFHAAGPELRLLLGHFEERGERHAAAYALIGLAAYDLMSGATGSALVRATEATARFEEFGDANGVLQSLITLSGGHLERGEHDAAESVSLRALDLLRERSLGEYGAKFRRALGIAAFEKGQIEVAIRHYEESIRLAREQGWGPNERIALRRLGEAYGALGRLDLAVTTLERCREMFVAAGDAYGEGLTCYTLGELALRRGLRAEAREHFRRCLDLVAEPSWRERAATRLWELSQS
ncbi:AfsR/SARP family transcriptional regulator [Nonomuraea sp. SBT364]|uniref:AfsR/SARP family transcriptional regulator n=1 Tax=Nonomuraea sp. SBT364 TaxID=1580530 RepID=UPI00066A3D33|nr:BTAD domain-containing putative transcriptional regulator [Nonomuraea sp. SBT364]